MIYKDCFDYLMLLEQGSLAGSPPWGMTQIYFTKWCTRKGIIPVDVMKAPREYASEFAYDEYYVPSGSAVLVGDMNFVLFQMAYNIGNGEAIKILQRVLNIPDDGIFGPLTKKTANESPIHVTIRKLLLAQDAYYKEIENPSNTIDEKGWMNRVSRTAKIVDIILK